jgi:uncharacterized damage-inducible protein DinB
MSERQDCRPVEGVDNGEIALMLGQLDMTTSEWIGEELGDVTADELVWQPFEGGHSIAALMVHIAEVEAFWLHNVGAGEPYHDLEVEVLGAVIDQDNVKWPTPPPGRPLSYYVELLNKTRARTKELIGVLNDPTRVSTRKDGREFTLRWLLTHLILHEAYHGGQAVLLLIEQRKRNA